MNQLGSCEFFHVMKNREAVAELPEKIWQYDRHAKKERYIEIFSQKDAANRCQQKRRNYSQDLKSYIVFV